MCDGFLYVVVWECVVIGNEWECWCVGGKWYVYVDGVDGGSEKMVLVGCVSNGYVEFFFGCVGCVVVLRCVSYVSVLLCDVLYMLVDGCSLE